MKALIKTYRAVIHTILIMVCMGVCSLPIFAETISSGETNIEYEVFEMEEDFMEEFNDLGDCVMVEIKIYNEDNQLVRCGSEENQMIKDLINRSDFLADVAGIAIYRLNQ